MLSVLPNPSLEATRKGMALGLRNASVDPAPHGSGAMPLRSPHLERLPSAITN
jgi:hypothetical protein